ncbi:MAG TPA: GTPase ObgE [Candidatus Sulfotelmatobacter sp.]|nr:GTPase ObgE [Candidatus Sulfotelmatobacter sp.]
MLIDEVNISVKGGDGGNGRVSFKRNAQTARGGPDGGNGGRGGDLYFEAINDITALSEFSYTKSVSAENGVDGGKQNLYGRNGKDKTVFVPMGTEVTNIENDEVFELLNPGEKVLIAKGGKGGRGNNEFKSATVQAPKYRETGEKGEQKKLRLVLKLVADIGLIGLPNAGKSSLLQALTNAHPKIGDYPFTTLEPNLGVMDGLVISDIPGLIEGASIGKGLGIKFLRHVEKTRILVHCLDSQSEQIEKNYKTVKKELSQYSDILNNKKEIVLLTKSDLVSEDKIEENLKIIKKLNKNSFCVSIYNKEDMLDLEKKLLGLK